MKHLLSTLALKELEEGKAYYNLQKAALGDEFEETIRNSIEEIFKAPYLYPVIATPVHRKVISRFPYNVFYQIDDDAIVILSIAHQHRKPFYTI